jgi:hypothetical protein
MCDRVSRLILSPILMWLKEITFFIRPCHGIIYRKIASTTYLKYLRR